MPKLFVAVKVIICIDKPRRSEIFILGSFLNKQHADKCLANDDYYDSDNEDFMMTDIIESHIEESEIRLYNDGWCQYDNETDDNYKQRMINSSN
jgi:hypothetical protein